MKFNEIISKKETNNTVVKINGKPVNVKKHLNAQDMVDFVESVVSASFVDGEYIPAYNEIATCYAVLSYFTDIDLSDTNADDVYKYINQSWYDQITYAIDEHELSNLNHIVYEQVRQRTKTSFDKLCDTLKEVVENVNTDDMEILKDLAVKLNGMTTEEIVHEVVKNRVDET